MWDKTFRKVVLVLGVAGLIVLVVSSELRNRLWSLTDAMEDARVVWRIEVMANAISVGFDRPILGNGYGRDHLRAALKEKYPEFANHQFVSHSHNLYTELISGVGFLGLTVFLWLLASACIDLIQEIVRLDPIVMTEERSTYLGLFGSLIAFIVGGLADVPLYHHETRIFFFTLLGLICLRVRSERTPQNAVPS